MDKAGGCCCCFVTVVKIVITNAMDLNEIMGMNEVLQNVKTSVNNVNSSLTGV